MPYPQIIVKNFLKTIHNMRLVNGMNYASICVIYDKLYIFDRSAWNSEIRYAVLKIENPKVKRAEFFCRIGPRLYRDSDNLDVINIDTWTATSRRFLRCNHIPISEVIRGGRAHRIKDGMWWFNFKIIEAASMEPIVSEAKFLGKLSRPGYEYDKQAFAKFMLYFKPTHAFVSKQRRLLKMYNGYFYVACEPDSKSRIATPF